MFFVIVYTYKILYFNLFCVLRISFYSNLFLKNLFDVISVYLYLFIIIFKYYIFIIVYMYIM